MKIEQEKQAVEFINEWRRICIQEIGGLPDWLWTLNGKTDKFLEELQKSAPKDINYENFGAKDISKNGCTCDPNVPKSKLQEVLTDLSKEQTKRLKKAGIGPTTYELLRDDKGRFVEKGIIPLSWKGKLEADKKGNFKIYRNTNLNYLDLKRDDKGHFLPKYKTIATFTYDSHNSGTVLPRTIEIVEKNDTHIIGRDFMDDKVKNFRKDRVIGKISYKRVKISP